MLIFLLAMAQGFQILNYTPDAPHTRHRCLEAIREKGGEVHFSTLLIDIKCKPNGEA